MAPQLTDKLKVTLVEALPNVIPVFGPEWIKYINSAFKAPHGILTSKKLKPARFNLIETPLSLCLVNFPTFRTTFDFVLLSPWPSRPAVLTNADPSTFHFRKQTQIPYSSMLFFAGDTSDYASNREVQQLGVTFVPIVDHEKGLTERRFEEGIKIWRERRRERALLTLTVPGVDDGTNGGRRGMGSGRRAAEEKRDERMSRRPVPPHSHHSDGALSRQQQQQQQQQFQARQQQAQAQQQQRTSTTTTTTTTTAHRTHPRPLQLQHKWNSESRQWEIVNTQQHYSSLRAPASPCSPTSAGSATAKERPWTADPLHHSHHHHSSHHAHDRHSSPAHGFGRARDVVWTPPLSVSSPEMEEDDDEDEDEDEDDEASEGSQGSGSTPSNW